MSIHYDYMTENHQKRISPFAMTFVIFLAALLIGTLTSGTPGLPVCRLLYYWTRELLPNHQSYGRLSVKVV